MRHFSERLLRFVATLTASIVVASLFAQYQVLIGDRDQERGVVTYNPSNNTLTIFGSCPPRSGAPKFYYGVDVRTSDSTVWACDILAGQIVVLDRNGNCLNTISTSNISGIPTGISIAPNGQYAWVSFQNNTIVCYQLSFTNPPTATPLAVNQIPNTASLYGLQISPVGGILYACDFGGRRIIAFRALGNGTLQELARISTTYNPYDVAIRHRRSGNIEYDDVYFTETLGVYGSNSQVSLTTFAYAGSTFSSPTRVVNHPLTGTGNVSFFGIALAPDNTLWVNEYVRGQLYQVTLSGTPTAYLRYDEPSWYKYGLGVAIVPRCVPNNGDIDRNCVVDDADLLTLLFNFGQRGPAIPGDLDCNGVVDDADLLQLLFNFGQRC